METGSFNYTRLCNCIIWDGMVILQQPASIQLTLFDRVAEFVFERVLTKKVLYLIY